MYPRQAHLDDQSLDLGRYIGNNQQDKYEKVQHHKNLHNQQLYMNITRINSRLQSFCNERVGNLTNPTPKQIQKTIELVQTLMNEIKKLQQIKTKLLSQRRQTQQNLLNYQQNIDKITKDKKTIQSQKQSYIQKYKNLQKIYKETLQKQQNQKQDLNKQIKQFQTRQKTFEAEFRKKQQFIKSLQDNIRKFQDKPIFKNSFDVIQKLQYGPNIYDMYSTNGQNQYSRLAKDARDEVYKKLTQQNQHLKQCLTNIYRQLNTVLQLKKQTLKNKKGYDGEYQNYFELNAFRAQTLNLPQHWSRDKLKQLNQNIQKFKQAIKIGDYSDGRIDQRKQGCVNGIKQLIKNYKQVVQTQDQLLNKVLLKSKEFKSSQLAHLQNRFSKTLDNNQIDRAKRFVEEQAQYLQNKNLELEKTRKMMQAAMKKAQENKREMIKQRQNFQEQALEMRRSVQILPAIIQQELKKALN